MKTPPKVGSRWRFSDHGAVYQIVEGKSKRQDYVLAKIVSANTDEPIGGTVELAIHSLGTTYKQVRKKGEK